LESSLKLITIYERPSKSKDIMFGKDKNTKIDEINESIEEVGTLHKPKPKLMVPEDLDLEVKNDFIVKIKKFQK